MGSYTTTSGGGGAIYKDGVVVSEQLSGAESVTVPSDKTWVVDIAAFCTDGSNDKPVKINGSAVQKLNNGRNFDVNTEFRTVLNGGDTVEAPQNGGAQVGGWSV